MELEVIGLEKAERWDEIIQSFENADVYYLSGYTKAFEVHGDGKPLLFYFSDKNNENKAINVVMKRDISEDYRFTGTVKKNQYFDLATPYGYGGLICQTSQGRQAFLENINKSYTEYCVNNGIITEFVRFHPNIENHVDGQFIYNTIGLGHTVCMDLSNREVIWNNITSKNRNVIRKAQRLGVEIKYGASEKIVEEFIYLYNATMKKDKAEAYYYFGENFYKSICEDLKGNSIFFYATLQNQILASSIILFGGERMHYHLSASDLEFRTYAPSNLLLYEAACWGAENGYKTFHLGGGLGSKEDSLFKFKKAFNKQKDTQFWIGRKVFDENKYLELIELRKNQGNFDPKTSFFPQYRG